MTFFNTPLYNPAGLVELASADNVPLVNGTPTLLSVTTPNDGKYHLIIAVSRLIVTVTEVGGAYNINTIDGPSGISSNFGDNAGNTVGPSIGSAGRMNILGPGSTISYAQTAALTGGAATVSFRIYMGN